MKEKRQFLLKAVSFIVFIIYLTGMFYFLFFSENYGRTEETNGYRYNLVLFNEIKRCIKYYRILGFEFVLVNLFGNIAVFMPFGFCLPIINKNEDRLITITIISFCFSLVIEAIQLLYKIGIFDADDIFLNTIGGILGFMIYRGLAHIMKARSREDGYAKKER